MSSPRRGSSAQHTPAVAAGRASRLAALISIVLSLQLTACLPYVVGNTPQVLKKGQTRTTGAVFLIPATEPDSGNFLPAFGLGGDTEFRWGLSERSDMAVRISVPSSVELSVRRMVLGSGHPDSAAMSVEVGLGATLRGGLQGDATLLMSLSKHGAFMPYGGVRALGFLPMTPDAYNTSPGKGAFIGVAIGRSTTAVLPEFGVYHHSRFAEQPEEYLVFVASVSFRGAPWHWLLIPILTGIRDR